MGDTGSLLLGFVIAVLCIRLLQINACCSESNPGKCSDVCIGDVMIPVFDTLRVFVSALEGQSPFAADKHIYITCSLILVSVMPLPQELSALYMLLS